MKFYLVLISLLLVLACEDPSSPRHEYKYKEGDVVALKADPTIHGIVMDQRCCGGYEVKFYNDNGTFTRELFKEFELVEYKNKPETETEDSTE